LLNAPLHPRVLYTARREALGWQRGPDAPEDLKDLHEDVRRQWRQHRFVGGKAIVCGGGSAAPPPVNTAAGCTPILPAAGVHFLLAFASLQLRRYAQLLSGDEDITFPGLVKVVCDLDEDKQHYELYEGSNRIIAVPHSVFELDRRIFDEDKVLKEFVSQLAGQRMVAGPVAVILAPGRQNWPKGHAAARRPVHQKWHADGHVHTLKNRPAAQDSQAHEKPSSLIVQMIWLTPRG
jgi:hypothetical protein